MNREIAPTKNSLVAELVRKRAVNNAARIEAATKRGLPKGATWERIYGFDSEIRRTALVAKLGLPKNATWLDIEEKDPLA